MYKYNIINNLIKLKLILGFILKIIVKNLIQTSASKNF
jgi:hypothetical protein